jgi:hypothetical protein
MVRALWMPQKDTLDNVSYTCMLSYPIVVSHLRFIFLSLVLFLCTQPMTTALHRSPNKLWRSNSIFNLCFMLSICLFIERILGFY